MGFKEACSEIGGSLRDDFSDIDSAVEESKNDD
jgi:hypothetical protein